MIADNCDGDKAGERLDLQALIAEGVPSTDALAILQGALCLTWQEARDRWEMLRCEREGRP